MPNDAGRHLVAFALGMRCFTCLGTSENPTRHLPAAGSVCKSQSVFKLLPGRLPWAVQKAVLAADLGLQQGREGLEGTTCQPVPYKDHPLPQASPWPPPTGSLSPAAAHRAVTTSHPLLQHCLGLSLIVFEEEFSTVSILFAQPLHTCAHICSYLLYLQGTRPTSLGRAVIPVDGRLQDELAGCHAWTSFGFTNIMSSSLARGSQEPSAGVGFG